jgi:hypothetical protein
MSVTGGIFMTDDEVDLAFSSYRAFLHTHHPRWLLWIWLKTLVRTLPENLAASSTLFSPLTPTPYLPPTAAGLSRSPKAR